MSEEWKEEFFEWKDEIESKYNKISESRIKYENKIKELEKWKKVEEEQHQNITKALDNFVIDAGAIGDSVYSNKLKSLENEIAEQKKMIEDIEETIVLNTCKEITKPYCPIRVADLDKIEVNNKEINELKEWNEKDKRILGSVFSKLFKKVFKLNRNALINTRLTKEQIEKETKAFMNILNDSKVNREALREDYQFKIKNLPNNPLREHYKGLLEKLDSKAEKKEDYFDKQVRLGNISKYKEDSGGERHQGFGH